jgi:DUF2075 family protein
MLVYAKSKADFLQDVRANQIDDEILAAFQARLGFRPSTGELGAWRNSMQFVANTVEAAKLADDTGVAIEFTIPLTSKRVDLILTGETQAGAEVAVIVELKQWSDVEPTQQDAIVRTAMRRGLVDTLHPSYQAWSYAALISEYNETVREEGIALHACAYLHNLADGSAINDPFYREHTKRAPAFLKPDTQRFADYLAQLLERGDSRGTIFRIDSGRLRPSKSLADVLRALLDGREEFQLIDEQKVAYEAALQTASRNSLHKEVIIVRGGPGTGKSVVAMNLLVALTEREKVVQYVSRNAAPRAVYASVLKGSRRKSEIDALFRGSGAFLDTPPDFFDALIVDEAHRLNEKSGLYGNLGENQVKELISAARTTVFFIDEDQRVTLRDIGTMEEIRGWAADQGARVTELELPSQFRCSGSDGYLAFLDSALGIRETANPTIDPAEYDFRVFDDPVELWDRVRELNATRNKARLVAGYCWPWSSKKQSDAIDITIPGTRFEAQWNLTDDGSLWIIGEHSVEQVGCIHTCQGLELDHVGVIVGPDLLARNGRLVTNGFARASQDQSVRGFRGWHKRDPEAADAAVDEIIRNTYRTLMSRGLRGCYVYCTDAETRDYFRQRIGTRPSPDDFMPPDFAAMDMVADKEDE